MRLLDFLFYYLTLWYTERKKKVTIQNATERTVYVLGICFLLWVLTIETIVEYVCIKSTKKQIPIVICLVVGLMFMQFLKYVYINKKRLKIINSNTYPKFAITERNGIVLAIVFVCLSFITPFLLVIILN